MSKSFEEKIFTEVLLGTLAKNEAKSKLRFGRAKFEIMFAEFQKHQAKLGKRLVPKKPAYKQLKDLDVEVVSGVLERCKQNKLSISAGAAELGVNYRTLNRYVKQCTYSKESSCAYKTGSDLLVSETDNSSSVHELRNPVDKADLSVSDIVEVKVPATPVTPASSTAKQSVELVRLGKQVDVVKHSSKLGQRRCGRKRVQSSVAVRVKKKVDVDKHTSILGKRRCGRKREQSSVTMRVRKKYQRWLKKRSFAASEVDAVEFVPAHCGTTADKDRLFKRIAKFSHTSSHFVRRKHNRMLMKRFKKVEKDAEKGKISSTPLLNEVQCSGFQTPLVTVRKRGDRFTSAHYHSSPTLDGLSTDVVFKTNLQKAFLTAAQSSGGKAEKLTPFTELRCADCSTDISPLPYLMVDEEDVIKSLPGTLSSNDLINKCFFMEMGFVIVVEQIEAEPASKHRRVSDVDFDRINEVEDLPKAKLASKRRRVLDVDFDSINEEEDIPKSKKISGLHYYGSSVKKKYRKLYRRSKKLNWKAEKHKYLLVHSSVHKRYKLKHLDNHPSAKSKQQLRYRERHPSKKKEWQIDYIERHPSAKKRQRARRLWFAPSKQRMQKSRLENPLLEIRRRFLWRVLRGSCGVVTAQLAKDQMEKATRIAIETRNTEKRLMYSDLGKLSIQHLRGEILRRKFMPDKADRNKILMGRVREFKRRKTGYAKSGVVEVGTEEYKQRAQWYQQQRMINIFLKSILHQFKGKSSLIAKREIAITLMKIQQRRDELLTVFMHGIKQLNEHFEKAKKLYEDPHCNSYSDLDKSQVLLNYYLGERYHMKSQEPYTTDVTKYKWFTSEKMFQQELYPHYSDDNVVVTIEVNEEEEEDENNSGCVIFSQNQVDSVVSENCNEIDVTDIEGEFKYAAMLAFSNINSDFDNCSNMLKIVEEKENVGRLCFCKLHSGFGWQFHKALEKLNPDLSVSELQTELINLEHCECCQNILYPVCPLDCLCKDFIKILREYVGPHGARARTILRLLYKCRQVNHWLITMDRAEFTADYKLLCSLLPKRKSVDTGDADNSTPLTETAHVMLTQSFLNEKFQKQILSYDRAISNFIKVASRTCSVCKQMGIQKIGKCLTKVEDLKTVCRINNAIVQRLINYYSPNSDEALDEDEQAHNEVIEVEEFLAEDEVMDLSDDEFELDTGEGFVICYKCFASIKCNEMPLYAELNGFHFDVLPKELSILNFYERLLIQRARSFLTIIQLKPYRMTNKAGYYVKALKGLVVHLPLNMACTLDYTFKKLPCPEMLHVIVYSLPTSKKEVWRNLVDLDKVTNALRCLKAINKEYEDIEIVGFENHATAIAESVQFATPELEENIHSLAGHSDRSAGTLTKKLDSLKSVETLDQNGVSTDAHVQCDGVSEFRNPLDTNQQTSNEETELARRSHLRSVLCSSEIEGQYTVMPVQTPTSVLTDTALYQQKRVEGAIIPISDKRVEVRSFAHLYADGKNSSNEVRERPVSLPMFTKAIMNHKERRFSRDFAYMFHLYHIAEQRALDRGIFACLHARAGNYTADQFRKMASEDLNRELEANLSMMFAQRRGSSDYWSKVNGDLKAMDEECGPATWFVTLSSAEYKWTDLWEYLVKMNADVPGIDKMQQAKICTEDPVSVARFFFHRFKAIFSNVICDKNGPLGNIIQYFWRLEYQARGAPHPHIHMKLWCADAPLIGKDDAATIQAFLYDKVTCSIPSILDDSEMRELITKLQVHRCTGSCLRLRNLGKGRSVSFCRYGYPRKVTEEFCLNTVADTVKSRTGRRKVRRLYDLPRKYEERFVNDFNPLLLLLWKANIDVQYIGEYSFILNKYVTSYVTKGEARVTAEMWRCLQEMNPDRSRASRLKSLGLFKLKDREAGVYEVAHSNLGFPLYSFSDHVKFVNVGFKKERKRKLKEKSEIAALDASSTDLFCPNAVDVYYPARPTELEECSLHDFSAWYQVTKVKPRGKSRTTVLALQNDLGFIRQRTKPQIIKTNHFSTRTSDALERYFRGLLMLYKPWRNEDNIMESYASFQEAFEAIKEKLPSMQRRFDHRKRLDDAEEIIERLKSEAKLEDEAAKDTCVDEVCNEDFATELESEVVPQLAAEELDKKIQSLNKDQRKVFDSVIGHIQHQKKHILGECMCECEETTESLVALVSGVGGCGKSFLIEVIADQLRFNYSEVYNGEKVELKDPVHIVAPTGLAAFNVHGVTLHKKFKLPVQHGDEHTFLQLHRDEEKLLQASLRNIHLLIIDEFSMVSNVTLLCVHDRLQQAFKSGEDFGGVNVLMFGDLLQLKPVRGSFCFEVIKKEELRKHFSGAIGLAPTLLERVWYFELQENMRQKGDLCFSEMLGRIRLGSPTAEDINCLKSRILKYGGCVGSVDEAMSDLSGSDFKFHLDKIQSVEAENSVSARVISVSERQRVATAALSGLTDISTKDQKLKNNIQETDGYLSNATKVFSKLLQKDSRAVCLLPKNDMVDTFNLAMIKEANIKTVTISAIDYDTGQSFKNKKKSKKKTSTVQKLKSSDTAGLQEEFVVGVGARVMLRRNISLEEGLVNGAIGYVTSITEPLKTPPSIYVQFEDHSSETKIIPVNADFEVSKGIIITRRQYPLCLGYALTIHKSQGLTLRSIIVDLGLDVFESGMAYVALSRVKSLDGIHLLDFNPAVLYCDNLAAKQYLKWREEGHVKGDLGPINERPVEYQRKPYQLKKLSNRKTVSKAYGAKMLALSASAHHCSSSELQSRTSSTIKASKDKILQSSVQVEWIKLQNPAQPLKTSCYANAVIQCFRQFSHFLVCVDQWIRSTKHRKTTPRVADLLATATEMYRLCTVSDSKVYLTNDLRKGVAKISNYPGFANFSSEEDAHEFFDCIIQTFPPESKLSNLFTFTAQSRFVCIACPNPVVVQPQAVECTSLSLICSEIQTFAELMERSTNPPNSIQYCKQCKTDRVHTEQISFTSGPDQKYLILLLNLFGSDSDGTHRYIANRKITNFSANKIYIKQFKHAFRTVAAVNRIGTSVNSSHFTCWIRNRALWLLINDDILETTQSRMVNGLRNVYMLCLEVCE